MVDQSRRNSRTGWGPGASGPYAGNDLSSQGPASAAPRTSSQPIQSFRTVPEGPSPQGSYRAAAEGGAPHENRHGPQPDGNGHRTADPHRVSTGQLVTQAAGQISTLVRTEMALGRAELLDKGKKLGLGGALLATAGVFSLFCFGLLLTLCVALLDRAWPLWLAVLVPLLALGALTLVLAGVGVGRLRKGASAPAQAADSVRDDIRSLKHAFQEGRQLHNGHPEQQFHNGARH